MSPLAERYFFIPLYILLLILAAGGLFFPAKAMVFKKTAPRLYQLILFLAITVEFPLLLRGWEIGIAYLKIDKSAIFDNSMLCLPFLFLGLFLLSLFSQKKNFVKMQTTSLTLAVFISVIISPFIYLAVMQSWLHYLE